MLSIIYIKTVRFSPMPCVLSITARVQHYNQSKRFRYGITAAFSVSANSIGCCTDCVVMVILVKLYHDRKFKDPGCYAQAGYHDASGTFEEAETKYASSFRTANRSRSKAPDFRFVPRVPASLHNNSCRKRNFQTTVRNNFMKILLSSLITSEYIRLPVLYSMAIPDPVSGTGYRHSHP